MSLAQTTCAPDRLLLMSREGQTVVDVGIHVNEEGKLCGDVNFADAEPVVDAITPVPGGVGSVTTSVLVEHVVDAALLKAGLDIL